MFSKSLILTTVALLMATGTGLADNLLTNPGFDTGTGGWSWVQLADTEAAYTWLDDVGNPPGSVELKRLSTAEASGGHRFYQVIPVTVGKKYVLQGQWKGDIAAGGSQRNWAEVFIGFTDTTEPDTFEDFGVIVFKKRWDTEGGTYNVDQSGSWDWENLAESLEPGQAIYRVATDDYMVVAFDMGGRAGAGQGWYVIDNLSVIACQEFPAADITGDCKVGIADMAVFASEWLACDVEPLSSCWK